MIQLAGNCVHGSSIKSILASSSLLDGNLSSLAVAGTNFFLVIADDDDCITLLTAALLSVGIIVVATSSASFFSPLSITTSVLSLIKEVAAVIVEIHVVWKKWLGGVPEF